MATENLLEETYRLLDASDLTYRQIAEGARVDINWLSKFKQRAIEEPGISKVQGIFNFLSSRSPQTRPRRSGRAA